ncbi:hypothetical protein C2I19_21510, partial [Chromobacterium alticapitis]
MRLAAWCLAACVAGLPTAAAAAEYVAIPGGPFRSALSADGAAVRLAAYRLRAAPVTNAEFLSFVKANPAWRRGRALALYANEGYLAAWR